MAALKTMCVWILLYALTTQLLLLLSYCTEDVVMHDVTHKTDTEQQDITTNVVSDQADEVKDKRQHTAQSKQTTIEDMIHDHVQTTQSKQATIEDMIHDHVQATPAAWSSKDDNTNTEQADDKENVDVEDEMNQEDIKEVFDIDDTLNNTDIRSDLPGLLSMYCPGADVCWDDNSDDVSEKGNSSSCCRACSCSEKCHLSRNCCFPSPDIDNNDTKPSSCYSTLYPAGDDSEQLGYKSYMMIDTEMSQKTSTINSTCGDTHVAPWGSLYPVYSKSRRKIYKNSVCAVAHGVTDHVPWRVRVACSHQSLLTELGLSSSTTTFGDHCDVRFEFPGDISDLKEHVCYLKLVSSCPETFNVGASMSSEKLTAACESGLNSPYRGWQRRLYSNVFCAVCHDRYFHEGCVSEDYIDRSRRAFTALFDGSVLETFNKPSLHQSVQQACFIKKGTLIESTCRPVLCPTGQTYTVDGVCEFILKTWYKPTVQLALQLVYDGVLNTTGLTLDSFQSPWLPHWTVSRIYYFPSLTTQPMLTDKIMIRLQKGFERINPKVFTRNVYIQKNKEWTVKTGNASLSLRADFIDDRDNDLYYGNLINQATRLEMNITRSINMIYKSSFYLVPYAASTTMGQMMYCNQVVLTNDEFRSTDWVLYSNYTSDYLLPGQYYYPDVNDPRAVRVCIEQSGLSRVRNGGQRLVMMTTYILFVYFLISRYI